MSGFSIAQWDEADRPREKLMKQGAAVLSNAELLAILIGSGTPEEDAVQLMKRVLADCDGKLNLLGKKDIKELCAYNGIGPAKAVSIIAACELGRRRAAEPVKEKVALTNSQMLFQCFYEKLGERPTEEIHVILLDNRLQVIETKCIGKGGLNEAPADVRVILRHALTAGASAIALGHNHPSGIVSPSKQDDRLTEQLQKAAQLMNIRLIDHIIVGENTYYSYSDEGRL